MPDDDHKFTVDDLRKIGKMMDEAAAPKTGGGYHMTNYLHDFSHRLARRLNGHVNGTHEDPKPCPCQECDIKAQLIRSEISLQRAFSYLLRDADANPAVRQIKYRRETAENLLRDLAEGVLPSPYIANTPSSPQTEEK